MGNLDDGSDGRRVAKCTMEKMSNTFWTEVFEFWQQLGHQGKARSIADIMQPCLWYNNYISGTTLFITKWFKSDNKIIITLLVRLMIRIG